MTVETRTKKRFGLSEGIVVVVAIIIIAALSYLAYSRIVGSDTSKTHTNAQQADGHIHDTMQMPSVNTTDDLDKATQSLDDSSFEKDGNADLDAQAGGI